MIDGDQSDRGVDRPQILMVLVGTGVPAQFAVHPAIRDLDQDRPVFGDDENSFVSGGFRRIGDATHPMADLVIKRFLEDAVVDVSSTLELTLFGANEELVETGAIDRFPGVHR